MIPVQASIGVMALMVGFGFTIIWKEVGLPEQLFDRGVTMIFAVIDTLLSFVNVKLLILPSPLAANPMDVLSFVHRNRVFAIELPVIGMSPVSEPAQLIKPETGSTVGRGLIVIEKLIEFPLQEFDTGVTVNREVIGTFPMFWPVNAAIFPVPLSAMAPIGISVLTH